MRNFADNSDELERIYRNRFDAHIEYRTRVWQTLVTKFFSRYIAPDHAVLDLGCGQGEFINTVPCGQKFAMDLNASARQHLNSNVTFFEQDCAQPWNLADGTLDVAFSSNFFEHLPSKQVLADMLREAFRCLRTGGRLIAMGPNIRFVGGAYWDFADHNLPLTDSSVAEILRMQNFRIEAAFDRFLPYTMVNTRPLPNALISMYLMMPSLWKIFGKQFLIIAKKP